MRDWLIMDSIWYPIIITFVYVVVVFKLAPTFMKNRPAYKLNTFIKCYNLFQIFSNAYIVINVAPCYPFYRALECRPLLYAMDACGMTIAKCGYFGIWLKLFDLSETLTYILRKKNNQVTFLHLYHHISTFLIGMFFTRYFGTESALLIPMLNCAVHVLMYFYYFLSNFEGPIKQKIIPFKRYLTLIQMGQFIIIILQLVIGGLIKECELSKLMIIIMVFNVLFNFWLFFRFYKKTYIDIKEKNI
ncbi:elongation of very long chain fatty acids protein 2-like isoform X2 [Leptopilina heterotoma]|nr:elongation of very long chain fatty acids protein 2-like isoform X2 [Leptopilina heterotoma]XP_043470572.1 elongation of very long chain fatty acids protein 2-like isoform X2 [Leptopilina heterotoma]XP_043470573.1 elongation of very long chain fatty acids protein 2-like isoform X2 [Leptopilina heterotoma]